MRESEKTEKWESEKTEKLESEKTEKWESEKTKNNLKGWERSCEKRFGYPISRKQKVTGL